MLRRSNQKPNEDAPATARTSTNLSTSREMLHCVSLQNLTTEQDRKIIEPTFQKKAPTYVLGFN